MQKKDEYNLLQEMLPDGNKYKFVKYDLQQNDFYIRDKVLSWGQGQCLQLDNWKFNWQ